MALFGFLCSGSILIFISYAFLFSTRRVVEFYTKARRGFEFAFGVLFGAAALKVLTARLVEEI